MDIYMKQMLAVKTGVNPFNGKVLTEWEKKQFAYAGAVGMLNLGYLGVWGSNVYKKSSTKKAPSLDEIIGTGKVGDFSNLKGSIEDIVSRIPKDANKRILTPQVGKVTEGFEYTWKTAEGTKMTVRVHGPDPSAPAGSNAANGWIARVQQGKKYLDPISGNFQPPGISKPSSEFYDEGLINSTHIPMQAPNK
ncbi:hypothetical protein HCJ54_12795 [Listeria grandensis]|nr:hypothetical protein [Listeria grandensis]